ncbi:Pentatricopeptide repeat-containing protein [Quillaja saponaria]|uniref:Pentatricopeptide repeat-containing protein n=1 Tax=Quillaja saponaria TaxID=32244 RepID=A0AAD7LZY6_QUISA|nr:Pentatricopeptide repeat-containing protein [Quillaja saponaria]
MKPPKPEAPSQPPFQSSPTTVQSLAGTTFTYSSPMASNPPNFPRLLSNSRITHILHFGSSHGPIIIRTATRASELEGSDGEDQPVSKSLKVFETLVKTYKDCGSAPFLFDLLIKACLGSKKTDPSIEIVCKCHGVDAGYTIYKVVFRLGTEVEKRVARVSPNVHTFNALMLCFHQGRMEQAEKQRKEMKSKDMEPDVMTYNTIIGGFCKTGEIGRDEELFRDMALGGTDSTSATYEHLIEGHCNVGDVDSALLVYKMCRRAFRPQASTLDNIIGILCNKVRIHDALGFMRSAMSGFRLSPRGKSYTALIEGLCNEGRQGKEEVAGALRKEVLGSQIQTAIW